MTKYLDATENGTQYREIAAAGVGQSQSVLLNNPAVEEERKMLERRALFALRKWARMNPFEQAASFELQNAVRDLLVFENRHQGSPK